MNKEKNIPLSKFDGLRNDLVKKHGQKIIPGCAKDNELNSDEMADRLVYIAVGDFLKQKAGKSYKVADAVYEGVNRFEWFINKRKFLKLLIIGFYVLAILFVFLILLKYLFF